MQRNRHQLVVLSVCAFLFVGCTAVGPQHVDVFSAARSVPIAMSEAIAVHALQSRELSANAVEGLHLHTLGAVDLHGEPFANITFVTPVEIEDVWEFAVTLTGTEWDAS